MPLSEHGTREDVELTSRIIMNDATALRWMRVYAKKRAGARGGQNTLLSCAQRASQMREAEPTRGTTQNETGTALSAALFGPDLGWGAYGCGYGAPW